MAHNNSRNIIASFSITSTTYHPVITAYSPISYEVSRTFDNRHFVHIPTTYNGAVRTELSTFLTSDMNGKALHFVCAVLKINKLEELNGSAIKIATYGRRITFEINGGKYHGRQLI